MTWEGREKAARSPRVEAIVLLFVVLVADAILWVVGSDAVDGYRATHGGVHGTVTVQHANQSSGGGEDAGVSYTYDGSFQADLAGSIRHKVDILGAQGLSVGDDVPVLAAESDASKVYIPGSAGWIANAIGATVISMVGLLSLIGTVHATIRSRRTSAAQR